MVLCTLPMWAPPVVAWFTSRAAIRRGKGNAVATLWETVSVFTTAIALFEVTVIPRAGRLMLSLPLCSATLSTSLWTGMWLAGWAASFARDRV